MNNQVEVDIQADRIDNEVSMPGSESNSESDNDRRTQKDKHSMFHDSVKEDEIKVLDVLSSTEPKLSSYDFRKQ